GDADRLRPLCDEGPGLLRLRGDRAARATARDRLRRRGPPGAGRPGRLRAGAGAPDGDAAVRPRGGDRL
ncbi:MAG: hypothetical protein AVDCRST_MAG24-1331, partial [uncultured Nocardioidaceae bacterium]